MQKKSGLVPKRYCVVRWIGPLLTSLLNEEPWQVLESPQRLLHPKKLFFLHKKREKTGFLAVKTKSTLRDFIHQFLSIKINFSCEL